MSNDFTQGIFTRYLLILRSNNNASVLDYRSVSSDRHILLHEHNYNKNMEQLQELPKVSCAPIPSPLPGA